MASRLAGQEISGIGDSRRARVGHQGARFTGCQTTDQARRLPVFVVRVMRNHPALDVVCRKEDSSSTGVLGGDPVHRSQYPKGAKGDVFQIPDRGGDKIENRKRRARVRTERVRPIGGVVRIRLSVGGTGFLRGGRRILRRRTG